MRKDRTTSRGRSKLEGDYRRAREGVLAARAGALSALLAGLLTLAACGGAGTARAPTPPFPTAIPTPSQNAAADQGEDPDAVEEAFLLDIQAVIDEVRLYAGGECAGLADLARADPGFARRLRGFADVTRRATRRDQVGARATIQALLDILDEDLDTMDRRLAACGIRG